MNTAALRAGAENLGRWALRRAQERSTWIGITMLLDALGHATLAAQITHYVDIGSVIFGVALTSATTTPHLAPAPEPLPLPDAPDGQAGGAGLAA